MLKKFRKLIFDQVDTKFSGLVFLGQSVYTLVLNSCLKMTMYMRWPTQDETTTDRLTTGDLQPITKGTLIYTESADKTTA